MKRLLSVILIVFLLIPLNCAAAQTKAFRDVSASDWFSPAVTRVCGLGYMSGTSADTFSPNEQITRAMAVQVLYKMSGDNALAKEYFKDVPQNAWHAAAVSWAKEKHIAFGTSDNTFSPEVKLTREQLICMLCRYKDAYGITLDRVQTTGYRDMDMVSEWAAAQVEELSECGIFTLRSSGRLAPYETVSRAEMAAAILRFSGDRENGVYDPCVHAEGIYLNACSVTLEQGQSFALTAVIYPFNTADLKISYYSAAPKTASVSSSGTVTAAGAGKTVITAEARDGGYRAACEITVTAKKSAPVFSKASNFLYNSDVNPGTLEPINRDKRIIDPNKPMVALTYDDGPRPASSTRILDVLEKYNSAATFFELGNLAQRYPYIIKREVDIGCEVACHSFSHPNLSKLSASQIRSEISSANDAIFAACNVMPRLVRPPYGACGQNVRNNAGAPLILWSIDTLDWKTRNAQNTVSVVMNQVCDGSVVLMHSIYDATADATEILVPKLIAAGYQLVTVSELAAARGVVLSNGTVYSSFYK